MKPGDAAMVGKVYLVGAGPGDVELLTVKALRLISNARTVVFDRLVSHEILALIPPGARRIDVGKQAKRHPVPQQGINDLLVSLGRKGESIVRLKGGDPFVFGRGGEEALALAAAGIAFEVVPGITTAQGCAASCKVPLTHRSVASGLRFITGHCQGDAKLDFDWHGLADETTTVVVYMGLANIGEIAGNLIAHGRNPSTPVLAVTRATRRDEQRLFSTLRRVGSDASTAGLASPTIFIIGKVVSLAHALNDGGCGDAEIWLAAAE